ncbi:MATE family efflux transporter [Mesorhizobium sp. BAC0120]|uniref:MATE family efflux transporter n=1 Tax=Mesorhizobium sp. BAC0120 TaxID=3090670 RepID=UPI00298D4110|nr:MATE family efflux transporter [Mesorhizobium sp. BAC0120]MDW6024045.1 MATE family efflux transporter [Mesorhizobium sp. BAC0120]
MTLAYLTTPLIGLVGTAVVGHMGDAALIGGLAAGAIILDIVFNTFNFLRSGTTGLVAQAFGRDHPKEEKAVLLRALAISLVIGGAFALLGPLVSMIGGSFMAAEERVLKAMDTYVRIRLLGAPFALANYSILGYVLGRGEGRLGLLLQAILNGSNVALAILFGLVLGWGVAGVAWGTVGGELIGLLVAIAILARRFGNSAWPSRSHIFEPASLLSMMALNRDIMIRSFVLLAAFALFTRQGAQLGTLTLATNSVLMNFFFVGGYFLDGLASAIEQLAGRAVGAGSERAFRKAISITFVWGYVLAGIATSIFLAFGTSLVAMMTTAEEVRSEAMSYVPWAAFTVMSGVLAWEMDGIFIGATWSRDMRNMMILSFVAYCIALFLLAPTYGNYGLWAALHVFLWTRGFSLLSRLPVRARNAFS